MNVETYEKKLITTHSIEMCANLRKWYIKYLTVLWGAMQTSTIRQYGNTGVQEVFPSDDKSLKKTKVLYLHSQRKQTRLFRSCTQKCWWNSEEERDSALSRISAFKLSNAVSFSEMGKQFWKSQNRGNSAQICDTVRRESDDSFLGWDIHEK